MKAKITKRLVDGLPDVAAKVYDDALTGFGVIVYASGKRAFFVEYGPKGARKRMVLGQYGPMTVEAARALALAKLAEASAGGDPLGERERLAKIPTFPKWRDEYMVEVRRRKKHPRHDEGYLQLAADAWTTLRLDQITRRDVKSAMEAVAARGQTTANRWLTSVRACFQAALRDGLITENPATLIKPFRESAPRSRVLSDEEFGRVIAAFEALPDPFVRAAFVILMDTGARKSEVLTARWEDFDLEGGLWRLPATKSGRPQIIPLTPGTVAYLRTVERIGPWLIPGRDAANHREDLRNGWVDIRKAAGVEDVTIHDLRRTFGLHIARKAGLHIASKLLRHSDIRVTERVYAPLGIDDLRAAVTDMQGDRGKVIELQKARAGRGA